MGRMRFRYLGDPVLTTPCQIVPLDDPELGTEIRFAIEALEDFHALGVAAPQIGSSKAFFVWDMHDRTGIHVAINPALYISSFDLETDYEACLSIEDPYLVPRYAAVILESQDLKGTTSRIRADGLQARLFQHECDHLAGKLIVDRASETTG